MFIEKKAVDGAEQDDDGAEEDQTQALQVFNYISFLYVYSNRVSVRLYCNIETVANIVYWVCYANAIMIFYKHNIVFLLVKYRLTIKTFLISHCRLFLLGFCMSKMVVFEVYDSFCSVVCTSLI